MKIDPGIIEIVEHILIRDVDSNEILINQRAKKAEKKDAEKAKYEDK